MLGTEHGREEFLLRSMKVCAKEGISCGVGRAGKNCRNDSGMREDGLRRSVFHIRTIKSV